MSLSTINIFAVFACLCLSLGVFDNFKQLFAIFACLCPSLCVFVNIKRLFAVFVCLCASLPVFACLCPSLRVFVCLCVVWVSLRYLDIRQSVNIGKTYSDSAVVTSGVSQGSIFAHLLLLCYINDIVISINQG